MSLKEQITEDMKAAMRAKDSVRLTTIRMLTAAMKQKEVDERVELTDTDVVAIVDKLLKQRRDSISQFEAAGRTDLADKEKVEVEVLSVYMPAQMGEAEVRAEIAAVIASVFPDGGAGPQGMGKVMAALKPRLAGKTDMTVASALVKEMLK